MHTNDLVLQLKIVHQQRRSPVASALLTLTRSAKPPPFAVFSTIAVPLQDSTHQPSASGCLASVWRLLDSDQLWARRGLSSAATPPRESRHWRRLA
jgi:hypothetical protein